jgi:hypothetical protein
MKKQSENKRSKKAQTEQDHYKFMELDLSRFLTINEQIEFLKRKDERIHHILLKIRYE